MNRSVLLLVLIVGTASGIAAPGFAAPAASGEAAADLIGLAEDGNPGAQVQVAVHYLEGSGGLPSDPLLAARWLERAAIAGNAYAQMRLGDLYAEGVGVARNPRISADWREKAANRGEPRAQFELGRMYLAGEGVPHDRLLGEYWIGRAAVEGHAEARARIAALRRERGIRGDRWMSAAAPSETATSPLNENAMPLVRLLESAEFWMEEFWHDRAPQLDQLAADGDPQAQFALGTQYLQGSAGRSKDIGRAIAWYQRAAQGGSRRAVSALARLHAEGTAPLTRSAADAPSRGPAQ